MVIVVVCISLTLVGIAVAVVWGAAPMQPPWSGDGPPTTSAESVRRMLWWLNLIVISGLVSGVLAAGPGGRLVMRLLAVTAGDTAQGKLTEAEAAVGRITFGGTVEIFIFIGLGAGLFVSLVFFALRRWLPGGRLGALALAALVLVVAGPVIEPLRTNNPDFGLVGPGWLAVVSLSALVFLQVFVLAAVAGRVARSLPLIDRRPAAVLPYLALLPAMLPAPLFLGVVLILGVGGALMRTDLGSRVARSRRTLVIGRLAIAAVGAVCLPGFVSTVTDIV